MQDFDSPALLLQLRTWIADQEDIDEVWLERFYFDADRRRAIIGRGLSRLLLGHYLGRPAHQIEFKYNAFGKPAPADANCPVQFNVSHSGDVILVATAIDRVLGVDVERIKQDTDRDNFMTGEQATAYGLIDAVLQERGAAGAATRV